MMKAQIHADLLRSGLEERFLAPIIEQLKDYPCHGYREEVIYRSAIRFAYSESWEYFTADEKLGIMVHYNVDGAHYCARFN
jgi:hypothetical protein